MAITKVHPVMIEVSNNVTSNPFGSSNLIPQFTFDASGVIVAGSNVAMQIGTFDIANGSITSDKILDGAVLGNKLGTACFNANNIVDGTISSSKLVTGNIALSKLAATGTADATTLLRGDGTWTAISGIAPSTTLGDVGTYAILGDLSYPSSTSPGGTRAGSALRYIGFLSGGVWSGVAPTNGYFYGSTQAAPSGTWQAMGRSSTASVGGCGGTNAYGGSLWVRIL